MVASLQSWPRHSARIRLIEGAQDRVVDGRQVNGVTALQRVMEDRFASDAHGGAELFRQLNAGAQPILPR